MFYLNAITPWKIGANKFFSLGHPNKKEIAYGNTNSLFQLFSEKETKELKQDSQYPWHTCRHQKMKRFRKRRKILLASQTPHCL
jgi:hypothetical protein